jgi:hypothetical protein
MRSGMCQFVAHRGTIPFKSMEHAVDPGRAFLAEAEVPTWLEHDASLVLKAYGAQPLLSG